MKKYLLFLLIIFVGLFSFACDDNNINKEEPNGDENKTNNEENPKEEKCVVSFYLDDNLFVRIEINKNTKIDRPTDPTIDDAIFDGWFTKDDVEWDFETPISSDLSLFGKYHHEEVINVTYTIYGEKEMCPGYRQQLRLVTEPVDADTQYTWRSSDEKIARVNENGLVTAIRNGTATILVVDENEDIKATFEIDVVVCDIDLISIPNMGGYEIIIMNAGSARSDDDPFLEWYKKPDKIYKQQAWREIELEYNCVIKVVSYPELAPWGTERINWLRDNASDNKSECDVAVINSNWIPELAKSNTIIDVSRYYNIFGKKQMDSFLKDAGTYKGKLYTATTGISTTDNFVDLGLYYNYGMLKRLGLDDPATLFNEGKWNYTGFKEWVRKAQAKMEEGQYALGGHPYYYYKGMTNAAGVKITDSVLMQTNVLTDAPKNAMYLIKELANEGCVCDNITWSESPDWDGPDWYSGDVLMTTGLFWFMERNSRWPKEKLEWEDKPEFGYVPFPYPDDVKKEDTRIGVSGLSVYAYISGRNYSGIVNQEIVYKAITDMFLRTRKYQNLDETFDAQQFLYDTLKKTLDNEASIEAMMYYDSSRVFFDPDYAMYNALAETKLRQPSIDVIFGDKEYDEAFGEAAQLYEEDFLNYYE